jgi:hypothetical protein
MIRMIKKVFAWFRLFFSHQKQRSRLRDASPDHRPGYIRYTPIESNPMGLYTLYVEGKTEEFLKQQAGVSMEDIRALLPRVYEKCRELGFLYPEPIHFMMEIKEENCERTSKTISRWVPPVPIRGTLVTHVIVIYAPEVRADMARVTSDILTAYEMHNGPLDFMKRAQVFSSVIMPAKKAKLMTGISHELVHIFATDDEKNRLHVMDLATLELLTDSINLLLLKEDYENGHSCIQGAFVEAVAYICNLLRKELDEQISENFIELMVDRAKLIIRDCQGRLGIISQLGLTRARPKIESPRRAKPKKSKIDVS